jgi:hypothetical protein
MHERADLRRIVLINEDVEALQIAMKTVAGEKRLEKRSVEST